MITKEERKILSQELSSDRVIAIIRGVAEEKLPPLLEALYDGGIRWAEITFDQKHPETNEATAAAIGRLKEQFRGKMHVGAGTVVTKKQLRLALKAGAEFIISPNTDPAIIRRTVAFGALSLPGAYTPTEIEKAYRAGADAVKVFPADALGIPYFKAVMAPLSHVPMMAVGGIHAENAADYLALGLAGVGVGSCLTPKEKIEKGDFAGITEIAKRFSEAAKATRK